MQFLNATLATRSAIGAWFLLTLYGCGLVHEEQIDGPYYLTAVDSRDEMDVSYKVGDGAYVGRIPATVFAVGWNSDYIVAKCHPPENPLQIEYYYLIRQRDGKYAEPSASVRGPLSQWAFYWASRDIGLPEFSKTLK